MSRTHTLREAPMNQRRWPLLCLLALPLLLATACRAQSIRQSPPEIQLPDGAIPGVGSIDASMDGGKLVELLAVNFSGRVLGGIGVDGQGGLHAGDEWGSIGGGMTVSLPKDPQKSFYVRIGWTDDDYPVKRQKSPEWGGGYSFGAERIYKSKLVRVDGPAPPDAQSFLVIFYPKGRVACEILGEKPSGYDRIKMLTAQKERR